MSSQLMPVRGVYQRYGQPIKQEGVLSGGKKPSAGDEVEYVVYIDGDDFGAGTSFDTQLTLPAGFKFESAMAEVTEAFVLGGTTPTINVGTNTSEGTNYAIELSEAQAEALGVYSNVTGAGTFANPLAAATAIGVALDGTTPTVTGVGKAKVVIRGRII